MQMRSIGFYCNKIVYFQNGVYKSVLPDYEEEIGTPFCCQGKYVTPRTKWVIIGSIVAFLAGVAFLLYVFSHLAKDDLVTGGVRIIPILLGPILIIVPIIVLVLAIKCNNSRLKYHIREEQDQLDVSHNSLSQLYFNNVSLA